MSRTDRILITAAILFSYPYEEVDDVKFMAPPGYKVESVPAAVPAKPSIITYEMSATQQRTLVEVKRRFVEQGILFNVKHYPALRAFFNMVKTNDDAQIVLQNAGSAKKD